jgi:phenylacetate-CoA ligase
MLTVEEEDNVLQPLIDYYKELDERDLTFELLSKQEIEKYQLIALNLTLRHVWDNNDYYRNSLMDQGITDPEVSTLQSLSNAPLLDKNVIRGDRNLLLSCPTHEIGQIHITSGTSGKPIYTSFTLTDQYVYELLPKYTRLFPEDEHDVVAVALPYEFALPGLGFQRLYQFAFGSMVLSLGKGGYMATVDKCLELMKEFRATIMTTTPSYAALMAEESEKLGIDLKKDIGLKRIILTGEGCSYTFRERLQEWWGCEISFFYGSTECGVIGVECSEHKGYHVAQGHVIVEIIDPVTEQILDHGHIGEIVVTTLLREGMPMLRYRTGDIGYLQKAGCTCGNPMEVLHLRGRQESQIELNGEAYSPFLLENFLLQVDEISMWYHFNVTTEGKLIVEVERFRTQLSDDELALKVESHMKKSLSIECEARVVSEIPRTYGKANRVHFI